MSIKRKTAISMNCSFKSLNISIISIKELLLKSISSIVKNNINTYSYFLRAFLITSTIPRCTVFTIINTNSACHATPCSVTLEFKFST